MSFDGIVLAAVRTELEATLIHARIDKIYQPASDTLVLHTRQKGITRKLLLSAHATHTRVHFTEQSFENPPSPPLFCMVLRKHLEGSRVIRVSQPGLERQLSLHVETVDELGRPGERVLVCEIMGKHSNIILVDPVTGIILDGIRRYTHAVSRHREVLPGRPYVPPPAQEKLEPAGTSEEAFRQRFLDGPLTRQAHRVLLESFSGFGPLTAREVVARAGLGPDTEVDACGDYEFTRLWQAFSEITGVVQEKRFLPTLVRENGRYIAFSAIDLKQYGGLARQHPESISQAVDTFSAVRQARERLEQQRRDLESLVSRELKRCYKKMSAQQQDVETAADADRFRLAGELVTAHIHKLAKGMTEAELENFYDPEGGTVTVRLERELTPAENAQAYFRKYNKAKSTARQAGEQLAKTQEEADYLESVLYEIAQAQDFSDLDQVREELISAGYLKRKPETRGKKNVEGKVRESAPLRFVSNDGLTILVGKNNVQNDYITLRMARGDDLWLHVKDIPGSHVLVRTEGHPVTPDSTLNQAALLAAYFSKARHSSKVPVDYTYARHVRKPKGAPPGKVIYDHQQTVFITPGDEVAVLLEQLEL